MKTKKRALGKSVDTILAEQGIIIHGGNNDNGRQSMYKMISNEVFEAAISKAVKDFKAEPEQWPSLRSQQWGKVDAYLNKAWKELFVRNCTLIQKRGNIPVIRYLNDGRPVCIGMKEGVVNRLKRLNNELQQCF